MYTSTYVHSCACIHTHAKSIHLPTRQDQNLTTLYVLDTFHFPQGALYIIHAFIHTEHPSLTCIYPLKMHLQQRHVRMTLCYRAFTLAPFRKGYFPPLWEAPLLSNTPGKPSMQGWRSMLQSHQLQLVLFSATVWAARRRTYPSSTPFTSIHAKG